MKYLSAILVLVTATLFIACAEKTRPSAHSQLVPAAATSGIVQAAVVQGEPATQPSPGSQPKSHSVTRPGKVIPASRHVVELNQKVAKLFERKEYTQCKQALDELLTITPQDDNAWYNLACAQSRLN